MKDYKAEIKTSGDFENDPQGAMDALSQTGFMVFVISDSWYDDKRAQSEWRFAKDLDKPMLYIITESGAKRFRPDMFTLNLVGTINDYGNPEKTSIYIRSFIEAFGRNLEKTEK